MFRGDPDHVSNAARALLADAAVKEIRSRMDERVAARIRAANTNDVEECRGAVCQFQSNAAFWSLLEQMVNEQDQREIRTVREVV